MDDRALRRAHRTPTFMPLWSPDIGGFGKVQTTSRQGIGVGPGVRNFFEKKYLGFSSAQQQIFRQYFLQYKTLVQRRGGIESVRR